MVEKWLQQVEKLMIQSLKDICAQALAAYPTTNRAIWTLTWPGQIVQCGDCIFWTTEATEAIQEGTLGEYLDQCTAQIEQSVQLVQGSLLPGNQITVEALIVIDVHCTINLVYIVMVYITKLIISGRDIIKNLHNMRISSIADFNWISQLRYYWNNEMVDVSMITTTVKYGFEYLGNTGRLVATPLTDRCYR